MSVFRTENQVVRLATPHGCQSPTFFISTRSAMCRDLAAQRVVGVEGAGPDAIGGDDGDVVEHYLLDVEQRAVHVVSAPLGRDNGTSPLSSSAWTRPRAAVGSLASTRTV